MHKKRKRSVSIVPRLELTRSRNEIHLVLMLHNVAIKQSQLEEEAKFARLCHRLVTDTNASREKQFPRNVVLASIESRLR